MLSSEKLQNVILDVYKSIIKLCRIFDLPMQKPDSFVTTIEMP